MNQVITIPRQVAKDDLVIMPRGKYEEMVRIIRKKSLDEDLKEAVREYEVGNYYGPFNTVAEGKLLFKSYKSKR